VPRTETFRVIGYRELMRALKHADTDSRRFARAALRESGETVRRDATERFASVSVRSAAGYKVGVTQKSVRVYQSLRKTTGKRPDYGALQMRRALLPALAANEEETVKAFEDAIDRIADRFERGP
jgi:hypothetical protein